MPSATPDKRPSSPHEYTSPAVATASLAVDGAAVASTDGPRSAKFRRVEAQTDYGHGDSQQHDTEVPAAKSSDPKKLRRVVEMNSTWTSFLENVWEEEDFEESLLALEGFVGPFHAPRRTYIRQLFAVALTPAACYSATSSGTVETQARVRPPSDDPFVQTERKIRLASLRLLEDVAATAGAQAVLRALRHHGVDDSYVAGPSAEPDAEAERTRESLLKWANPGPEDATIDPSDSRVQAAGRRILRCEDVWAFLGGAARKKKIAITAEQPIVRHGWEVLRTLVVIWETEQRQRAEQGHVLPVPPTLLQSLLPNTSGVRQITARPIDALMWPFRFGQESDDAQKETKDKDAKDQDLKKQHTDEPTLFEKRVTAVRLLALFGNCARHGRILSSSLLSELAPRLKVLKPSSLSMLLEMLLPLDSAFTAMLCAHYLETFSHRPVETTTMIKTAAGTVSSQTTSFSPAQPSPSRLRVYNVLASPDKRTRTASQGASQSSTMDGVHVTGPDTMTAAAAPWSTSLREFVSLWPQELPPPSSSCPASVIVAPAPARELGQGQGRGKPRRTNGARGRSRGGEDDEGGDDQSMATARFEAIVHACESYLVVKEVFVEAVVTTTATDSAATTTTASTDPISESDLGNNDEWDLVRLELSSYEQAVQAELDKMRKELGEEE